MQTDFREVNAPQPPSIATNRIHNAWVTRCAGTDEGNPRPNYAGIRVMIPDIRARQPCDGPMNCGSQSADISMIIVADGSRIA
jgi:hypothetical protein